MNSPYMLQRFEAPEKAALVADHIAMNARQEREQTRFYFDNKLQLLSERSMGLSTYDPRVRPWYTVTLDTDREAATKPYLYFFIGKVGITVGRQSRDGRAVVASDITLEHLSETLTRHRISPSTEAVLFNEDGRAIAYRDTERLILKTEGTRNWRRSANWAAPCFPRLPIGLRPRKPPFPSPLTTGHGGGLSGELM